MSTGKQYEGPPIEEGVALALSGGGFRAMLYHVGALWRLNELGLLNTLDRLTSVSGGALLAGCLAARWSSLRFDDSVAMNLREQVFEDVLRFSRRLIDIPAGLAGFLPLMSAASAASRSYRKHLVGDATLQDLPDRPRFIFLSTHLQSGQVWRFSKPYMGSWRIGIVKNPPIKLASALAASAAFPPFLSPLTLSLAGYKVERTPGADLHSEEFLNQVDLTDGGVFDNLGLSVLQRRYKTLLISDAGSQMKVQSGRFHRWGWGQIMRAIDTPTENARAFQRRELATLFQNGARSGTMWRLGTNPLDYPVGPFVPVHPDWPFFFRTIRTRLNPFTDAERGYLVNWGYISADAAIRGYFLRDTPLPTKLPFPSYTFDVPPPTGPRLATRNLREEIHLEH
jgi:NTE family protein